MELYSVQEVTSHSACAIVEIRKQVSIVNRYYSKSSFGWDATERFCL